MDALDMLNCPLDKCEISDNDDKYTKKLKEQINRIIDYYNNIF